MDEEVARLARLPETQVHFQQTGGRRILRRGVEIADQDAAHAPAESGQVVLTVMADGIRVGLDRIGVPAQLPQPLPLCRIDAVVPWSRSQPTQIMAEYIQLAAPDQVLLHLVPVCGLIGPAEGLVHRPRPRG